MYVVKVTNEYNEAVTIGSETIAGGGGTASVGPHGGNLALEVPGMGSMAIVDLGDNKIPGYPELNETWGILMSYQTIDIYMRYEGDGEVEVTVNTYGGINVVPANGRAIIINLDGFTLGDQTPFDKAEADEVVNTPAAE